MCRPWIILLNSTVSVPKVEKCVDLELSLIIKCCVRVSVCHMMLCSVIISDLNTPNYGSDIARAVAQHRDSTRRIHCNSDVLFLILLNSCVSVPKVKKLVLDQRNFSNKSHISNLFPIVLKLSSSYWPAWTNVNMKGALQNISKRSSSSPFSFYLLQSFESVFQQVVSLVFLAPTVSQWVRMCLYLVVMI